MRAMAAGLTPAFNDARMRFAIPSGILSIPLSLLLRIVADWPCDDALVGAAGALLFLRPRRLISMVTAASSRSSWASSRYFRDPERSLGRVTRAGDGAPIDDGDEARDDAPGTDDEAWFCRSNPRITQECRTTMIGAISLAEADPSRSAQLDVHTSPGTACRVDFVMLHLLLQHLDYLILAILAIAVCWPCSGWS